MTRRSEAELDLLMRRLGRDLSLRFPGPAGFYEDGDLETGSLPKRRPRRRDLLLVEGIDSARQMLVNRLMTRRGELAPLGHPDYGSRHHELIGEPNVARTRNLVKLHVLTALNAEPRVQKVLDCTVYAPHEPPRGEVRIEATLRLIDQHEPLNLVIPFSLEGDA